MGNFIFIFLMFKYSIICNAALNFNQYHKRKGYYPIEHRTKRNLLQKRVNTKIMQFKFYYIKIFCKFNLKDSKINSALSS